MEQKLVKLNDKEVKKIMLNILEDVVSFCETNDIKYFLGCGTLLGAAKYKGFIPWDDDIDLMMPRPDYNRFLDMYKSDNYVALKPENGMFFYAKVYNPKTIEKEKSIDYKKFKPIGISVDIFPLDGISSDNLVIERMIKKSSFYETLLRLANQPINYKSGIIRKINRIVARLIGSRNIVKMIEKNAQKYSYDNSDYVIRYKETTNGTTVAMKKEIFNKANLVFEGKEYCVPSGYDEWLRSFYGDNYLEYDPPTELRVRHDKESYIIQ